MKRFIQSVFLSATLLISCSPAQKCPENINILPMYGEVEKCDRQIAIDNDFIADCDRKFKDRSEATQYHVDKGWEYFYKNDINTAMKRFNQAWLLDSLNADVYWGFGNILGEQQKYQESFRYFDKSLALNPDNSQVWFCSALSYGKSFILSQDISVLNKAIENLKQAVSIDPTHAMAYAQLTASYSYFNQTDSARKYMEITDRIDPKGIHPELRRLLTDK